MPPKASKPTLPARAGAALAVVCLVAAPLTAQAQTSRLPPIIDQLTSPLSDGELGGLGCLAGIAASGGALVALAGAGPVAAVLEGPIPPVVVLQGGAALAFMVSSACYVGQAVAPVAALGWNTITDMLTPVARPGASPTAGSPVADAERR